MVLPSHLRWTRWSAGSQAPCLEVASDEYLQLVLFVGSTHLCTWCCLGISWWSPCCQTMVYTQLLVSKSNIDRDSRTFIRPIYPSGGERQLTKNHARDAMTPPSEPVLFGVGSGLFYSALRPSWSCNRPICPSHFRLCGLGVDGPLLLSALGIKRLPQLAVSLFELLNLQLHPPNFASPRRKNSAESPEADWDGHRVGQALRKWHDCLCWIDKCSNRLQGSRSR